MKDSNKEKIEEEQDEESDGECSRDDGSQADANNKKSRPPRRRPMRLGKGGNFSLDEIIEKLQNFETWENFEVPKL